MLIVKKGSIFEKIGLFFVVPCLLAYAVYYIMVVKFTPVHGVPWQDLLDTNTIVSVETIDEKQFGEISVKRGDTSLSSDTVNSLLFEYGADVKGMDPQNIEQKIHLLLTIAAPDFWRKNYLIHPQSERVESWLAIHKKYLEHIKSVKTMPEFFDFSEKVRIHNEYEARVIIYRLIKEDLEMDLEVWSVLETGHAALHNMADTINKGEGEDLDMDLVKKYEEMLVEQFRKEEQNIIYIMLNMYGSNYVKYLSYIRCSRYHPDRCAYRFL